MNITPKVIASTSSRINATEFDISESDFSEVATLDALFQSGVVASRCKTTEKDLLLKMKMSAMKADHEIHILFDPDTQTAFSSPQVPLLGNDYEDFVTAHESIGVSADMLVSEEQFNKGSSEKVGREIALSSVVTRKFSPSFYASHPNAIQLHTHPLVCAIAQTKSVFDSYDKFQFKPTDPVGQTRGLYQLALNSTLATSIPSTEDIHACMKGVRYAIVSTIGVLYYSTTESKDVFPSIHGLFSDTDSKARERLEAFSEQGIFDGNRLCSTAVDLVKPIVTQIQEKKSLTDEDFIKKVLNRIETRCVPLAGEGDHLAVDLLRPTLPEHICVASSVEELDSEIERKSTKAREALVGEAIACLSIQRFYEERRKQERRAESGQSKSVHADRSPMNSKALMQSDFETIRAFFGLDTNGLKRKVDLPTLSSTLQEWSKTYFRKVHIVYNPETGTAQYSDGYGLVCSDFSPELTFPNTAIHFYTSNLLDAKILIQMNFSECEQQYPLKTMERT